MNDPNEKKQDDLMEQRPGLFMSRMATKDVHIGDVVFKIKAIESTVYSMLQDNNQNIYGRINTGLFAIALFRHGVVDIQNLYDENLTAVKPKYEDSMTTGKIRKVLAMDIVEGFPVELINKITNDIIDLSQWTKEDADRTGFTKGSQEKSSANENTDDTQTEPLS